MATRIFIHIGLHKTGTTSIQAGLAASRSCLAESGFAYPMSLGPDLDIFGHHLIPWAACTRTNYLPPLARVDRSERYATDEKVWSALRFEIESTSEPNMILSSEEFDILRGEEIETIGAHLGGCEIVPVIFLRRFSDFLESAYRTTIIHNPSIISPAEFVKIQRSRLDYRQMIRDWLAISAGSARVINYDDPSVKSESLATFLNAIGAPSSSAKPRRLNDSYPAFACELVRFMRMKGCSEDQLKHWVQRVMSPNFSSGNAKHQWCLPQGLIEEYDARYNDEITALTDDSELKPFLWNEFSPIKERKEIIHIGNPVHALLALVS